MNSIKKRNISFLMSAFLLFCLTLSCVQIKPIPRNGWSTEVKPLWHSSVVVFYTNSFWSAGVGNGVIIHSSEKHGTFVLTAYHVVDEHEDNIKVGILDYSFVDREKAGKEYNVFTGKVVYPKPPSPDDDEIDEIKKRITKMMVSLSDFAVIKLDTELIFKSAELWTDEQFPSLDDKEVEIISIYPERYPHSHKNKGTIRFENDIVTPGHSGSGIFYKEKLVVILCRVLKDTSVGLLNPKIPDIVKKLSDAGLGYIIKEKTKEE